VQHSALSPASEIRRIASHSPFDAAAEPASITSTPMEESFSAIWSFSCGSRETPGVCSPSRNVVSKKRRFSTNKTICHGCSTTLENGCRKYLKSRIKPGFFHILSYGCPSYPKLTDVTHCIRFYHFLTDHPRNGHIPDTPGPDIFVIYSYFSAVRNTLRHASQIRTIPIFPTLPGSASPFR
jgi:hypothetical protein